MNKPDPILYDLPMLIAKNKTNLWQEHSTKTSTALMRFLKKHDLLIGVEPFDEQGKLKTNTIIKKSNLTPDGLELFKTAVDDWLASVDKTTAANKYQNVSRLEQGLAKIRENKNKEVDFIVYDVAVSLATNKINQLPEPIIQSSIALLVFLKQHQLLIGIEPFDKQGNLKTDTVIKKSNLTPDGLELFKTAVDDWLASVDKTTATNKYQNVSRLEQALAQIRESD
ncbi:hypothetical protein J3U57_06910 [Gilliamella sp. B3464]|uniref:hypothetical protein n=1 Tax=unclassified Gilliamella TaxID=2685620 RepID=UPI00226A9895|nr:MULTISPECIES: hypothetical protein [unclassified Gilliamella]MCX8712158.1 hypothetical protein [Gilliamella sp. B3468]MCX8751297.1 hypothetical protein [Gilliamella sp. B3464]